MPNDGMGPRHSIRIGSIIKFKMTVPKIIYIGTFTSQIPLKIDCTTEKIKVNHIPRNVIFIKFTDCFAILGSTPI